jgi:hypothetical protein
MAKLLVEQFLYPSIVPNRLYPQVLKKCGWAFEDRSETITSTREVRSLSVQPLPTKHGNGAGGPLPTSGSPPSGGTTVNSEVERWYCLPDTVDALTRRGWRSVYELESDDELLGINPETGLSEWQPLQTINTFQVENIEMTRFESMGFDILSTENHRWLVGNKDTNKLKFKETGKIRPGDKIPVSIKHNAPTQKVFTDDFVELVGWFWTEGTGTTKGFMIYQSESHNPENSRRIEKVLSNLYGSPGRMCQTCHRGSPPCSHVGRNHLWQHSTSREGKENCYRPSWRIGEELNRWAYNRVLSMEFLTRLTEDQLQILLEVSVLAEGGWFSKTNARISQNTGPRSEAFRALCVLAGWRVSSFEDGKVSHFSLSKDRFYHHRKRHRSVERYSGTIWCPTVPLGNWMARNGTKTFYTGNSFNASDLPNGIHGHRPSDAFDANPNTFYLSVGNSDPSRPFAVAWIEGTIRAEVNAILVHPFMGNYECYISVEENGQWVNGANGAVIPYNSSILFENGNEPFGAVDSQADIFYVKKTSIPWETPTVIDLPRRYNARKIRLTFRNLQRTQWGPYYYRAGVRRFGGILKKNVTTNVTDEKVITKQVKVDGNTTEYTDVVKQFLLWAGWEFHSLSNPNSSNPIVYGDVEDTGARPEFCINEDVFDRKTVWDAINVIRDIVGYNFYIKDDGRAVFVAPNFWAQGNFLEDRTYTEFIPQIDERKTLTAFQEVHSDQNLRTSIVISSNEPTLDQQSTISARFIPPAEARKFARGMERPFMWVNENFTSQEEMEILAELVALRIWFKSRQQQVTMVGNPTFEIDDQVRVYERQSGQVYVLYINGISSNLDMDSGSYTMTLTTNWLGTSEDWVINSTNIGDAF